LREFYNMDFKKWIVSLGGYVIVAKNFVVLAKSLHPWFRLFLTLRRKERAKFAKMQRYLWHSNYTDKADFRP